MINKKEEAIESFSNGFNCAQAIFSTYAPLLGFNSTDALKIACGFGAGMGRLQKTCGAVTGAVLLIGLKHGKIKQEDDDSKESTYNLVRKFFEEFIAINGSTDCKDLLGCDISTPEGLQFARDNNLSKLKCEKYVGDAAELIEKILFHNRK